MKDYIVVHDGVFHADDVYAVALAKLFNLKGSDNIIRTRNKEFKCMIYPNIRGGYGVQAISDFIDDKLVNRCSCDLPAVTNTETQELIDGVRVEFVHRNKFLAVVHGELEDVKVFAKNHFK